MVLKNSKDNAYSKDGNHPKDKYNPEELKKIFHIFPFEYLTKVIFFWDIRK